MESWHEQNGVDQTDRCLEFQRYFFSGSNENHMARMDFQGLSSRIVTHRHPSRRRRRCCILYGPSWYRLQSFIFHSLRRMSSSYYRNRTYSKCSGRTRIGLPETVVDWTDIPGDFLAFLVFLSARSCGRNGNTIGRRLQQLHLLRQRPVLDSCERKNPPIQVATDTQAVRTSSSFWIGMGIAATAFMAFNCYVG